MTDAIEPAYALNDDPGEYIKISIDENCDNWSDSSALVVYGIIDATYIFCVLYQITHVLPFIARSGSASRSRSGTSSAIAWSAAASSTATAWSRARSASTAASQWRSLVTRVIYANFPKNIQIIWVIIWEYDRTCLVIQLKKGFGDVLRKWSLACISKDLFCFYLPSSS